MAKYSFGAVLLCLLVLLHLASLSSAAPAAASSSVIWTVLQPNTTNTNSTPATPYQVFLSHRRVPSKSLAWLLKVMLEQRGVHAYLDVDDLRGGFWHPQLISGLDQSPNFVFILSKTTLDRCIGDTNFEDMVHQEIREAVTNNKNIVLVYDEYDFPPVSQFSNVIQTMFKSPNQVTWDHGFPVNSLNQIINKLVLPATAG